MELEARAEVGLKVAHHSLEVRLPSLGPEERTAKEE